MEEIECGFIQRNIVFYSGEFFQCIYLIRGIALEAFGEDVLKAFQLRRIDPDKVILTPKLIRYNH